jgi:hypothetical protein
METYKVTANWDEFEKFLDTKIDSRFKNSLGVWHNMNEIYLKTTETSVLNIISNNFPISQSEPPDAINKMNSGWYYLGNSLLI